MDGSVTFTQQNAPAAQFDELLARSSVKTPCAASHFASLHTIALNASTQQHAALFSVHCIGANEPSASCGTLAD